MQGSQSEGHQLTECAATHVHVRMEVSRTLLLSLELCLHERHMQQLLSNEWLWQASMSTTHACMHGILIQFLAGPVAQLIAVITSDTILRALWCAADQVHEADSTETAC